MRLLFVFTLALVVLPSAGATLPGSPIVAGPGAWVTDFATKLAEVPVGGELTFTNGDVMRHDVVALGAYGQDTRPWCRLFAAQRCPLFWSPLVSLGESTLVEGLDQLAPASTYTFYCTIHPQMRGILVALPVAGSE